MLGRFDGDNCGLEYEPAAAGELSRLRPSLARSRIIPAKRSVMRLEPLGLHADGRGLLHLTRAT
jgi:hypothetical protein